MERIHKSGVRHRDIWPHNILRDQSGRFAIIDFDMAELLPYPSEAMTREALKVKHIVEGTDDPDDDCLYSF